MRKNTVQSLLLFCMLFGALPANAAITWAAGNQWRESLGADGAVWWESTGTVPPWDVARQIKRLDGNKRPITIDKHRDVLISHTQNGPEILDTNQLDTLAGIARRMIYDADGRPWVVTTTNNLYRKEGNTWKRLPGKLSDIAIGKNGAIWGVSSKRAQGTGYPVLRFTGAEWEETGMAARAIPDDGSGVLAVDGSGEAWVLSTKGTKRSGVNVFRHTPDGWKKMPKINRPVDIVSDPDGVVWIRDTDRKHKNFIALYKWAGSDWEVAYRVAAEGSFAISSKGYPVFSRFYIPEQTIPVKLATGWMLTPDLGISKYTIDTHDVVWVIRGFSQLLNAGYRREILKWNGQQFEPGVDTRKLWQKNVKYVPSDLPEDIAIDADGSPWIIGNQGLIYRRVDDEWQKADDRNAVSIRADANGVIWALMPPSSQTKNRKKIFKRPVIGGAVYRWDDGRFKRVGEELPGIHQFAIDQHQTPWVTYTDFTSKGRRMLVSRLVDGQWTTVPLPDDFTVTSPMLGGGVNGAIWLGGRLKSQGVLLKWTGTGWKKHSDWRLGEQVNSDSEGRIWSVYQGGFSIIDSTIKPSFVAMDSPENTKKSVAKKQPRPSVSTPAAAVSAPKTAPVKAAKPPVPEKPVPEKKVASGAANTGLVGCWKWFNGAYIVVDKNGSVRNGAIAGTWSPNPVGGRYYTITWPSFFDAINLSEDGKSLAGFNLFGLPVSGTRLSGAVDSLVGEWHWINGIKVSIKQDKTVTGGDFRGVWKKVDNGYTIEWPIVDVVEISPDGAQLQGKNQFGPVAAALDAKCTGP